MRASLAIPARLRLWRAILQQAHQFRPERRKLRPDHSAARVNDKVPSWGYLQTIEAQNLSDAPLDAVADHRAAQLLLHADAEAAAGEPVRPAKDNELLARAPPASAVHRVVFAAAHQADRAGMPEPRAQAAFRWA